MDRAWYQVLPKQYTYKGLEFFMIFPQDVIEKIKSSFIFKETDVVVCTYPKCGTTWTQEIVWLLTHNCDVEGSRSKRLMTRVPFLEIRTDEFNGYEMVEQMEDPRYIKTHLPIEFLPESFSKPKIIVVFRNCKDAVVSLFHHYHLLDYMEYKGSFAEFFKLFQHKKTLFGDYFDWADSVYPHGINNPNFLFITYDELKFEPHKTVGKIAQFMGVKDENNLVERVVKASNFKEMKDNPSTNFHTTEDGRSFVRKGETGSWKQDMTQEQSDYIDKLVEERLKKYPMLYELNKKQSSCF